MSISILVGFMTFLLSLIFVWLVEIIAYNKKWISIPREDRWHKRSVALYGGIGIFISFVLGILIYFFLNDFFNLHSNLFAFLIGSIIIFFVGLIDDRLRIKPSTKLIGEIMAVSVPIAAGWFLDVTPWDISNIIITFFWFLGIINAVNLIDNMDGLASGVVLISTFTLIVLRIITFGFLEFDFVLATTIIFFCAVLGFWFFNRRPASIFMGDGGSLFLGYLLAGIAIQIVPKGFIGVSSTIFALFLPVAALAVPIFDTILVSTLRISHGRSVSVGGKDHSSHRLVGLGFSEDIAVTILYGLAMIGGLLTIAISLWPEYLLILGTFYVLFLVFIGIYLGRVKIYSESQRGLDKTHWTPLITHFFHKRHVVEVFLDFVLISVSYYFAIYLRFEGALEAHGQLILYVQSLPILVASCLFVFYVSGIYRGIWHFITIADLERYIKGVIGGVSLTIFLLVFFYRFEGYSRAAFFIFAIILFLSLIGTRLSFRIFDNLIKRKNSISKTRNIVVYGAGRGGRLLYDECLNNSLYEDCSIIGFIDDDPEKQNRSIAGITIYPREIFQNSQKYKLFVHEIWVSSEKISHEQIINFSQILENSLKRKIRLRRFSFHIDEIKNL